MSSFKLENNIIKCSALQAMETSILHGFSCRYGGVSALPETKSMNLGFLRGDDEATVNENLRIFTSSVGIDVKDLVLASQLHTTNVVYADETMKFKGRVDMSVFGFDGVDGFVTDKPGVALLIRVADCIPVLLADPEAKVIGAAHAGWRGTMNKIAAVTAEKMLDLGAKKERLVAAIGAGISPCCYTVGNDFYKAFEQNAPELLKFITDESGVLKADLKGMNRDILLACGLSDKNIYVSDECTCCAPDKFFSHRASKGKRGTMGAVIMIGK